MGKNKKVKSNFFLSKFSKSPFFAMSTRIYPMYRKGNPQLRVFLPNFWMKMIKPKGDQKANPDQVCFHVSSEMTGADVKQYLEKIYGLPVLNVKTINAMGPVHTHMKEGFLWKEDDRKLAFVNLPKGTNFEYPTIIDFDKKDAGVEDQRKQLKKAAEEHKSEKRKSAAASNKKADLGRKGIPSFFG